MNSPTVAGDVLRFLSKKNDVWFPKLKPVPVMGYENAPATTKEKGRRNGYESHRVLTGEGAVTVQVPQVRETEKVFQSKILGDEVMKVFRVNR